MLKNENVISEKTPKKGKGTPYDFSLILNKIKRINQKYFFQLKKLFCDFGQLFCPIWTFSF